jgi:hypothetical protein
MEINGVCVRGVVSWKKQLQERKMEGNMEKKIRKIVLRVK